MQEFYFLILIPYGERRINRNWKVFLTLCSSGDVSKSP